MVMFSPAIIGGLLAAPPSTCLVPAPASTCTTDAGHSCYTPFAQSPECLAEIYFSCTQSGLIAIGVDDGLPDLAEQAVEIIKAADIPVTFFVQGKALDDKELPFTKIYKEMDGLGHQIAMHSYDHPDIESLRDDAEIDLQFRRSIAALKNNLNLTSKYFRPPFGIVGPRTGQRLAMIVPDPKIIMWNIDIEDWKWGNSSTPEKQLQAFEEQLNAGGDVVVMHYLYESTLSQMQAMIDLAKAKGRTFVRMDQCVGERDAKADWKKVATNVRKAAQQNTASTLSNPIRIILRLVKRMLW